MSEKNISENTLILGNIGCGALTKIIPAIIKKCSGNYIVVDSRDMIYDESKDTLLENGYDVKCLRYSGDSDIHYNPFGNITDTNKNFSAFAEIIASGHIYACNEDDQIKEHNALEKAMTEAYAENKEATTITNVADKYERLFNNKAGKNNEPATPILDFLRAIAEVQIVNERSKESINFQTFLSEKTKNALFIELDNENFEVTNIITNMFIYQVSTILASRNIDEPTYSIITNNTKIDMDIIATMSLKNLNYICYYQNFEGLEFNSNISIVSNFNNILMMQTNSVITRRFYKGTIAAMTKNDMDYLQNETGLKVNPIINKTGAITLTKPITENDIFDLGHKKYIVSINGYKPVISNL